MFFSKEKQRLESVNVYGLVTFSARELYENAREAVMRSKFPVNVEYITDRREISRFGRVSLPLLVINGRIVSRGRVLKVEKIKRILKKYK